MRKRILIVEDDASLARVLRDNLVFDGFEVACAADGHTAVDAAQSSAPDLVILDASLPDCDGFDLVGLLRSLGQTAVIMLTARSEKADKLRGLNLGADDYVTKPFDLDELLARIHAVLRRATPDAAVLRSGRRHHRLPGHAGVSRPAALRLSHREFELLRYLAQHRGRVVFRAELLREVWKSRRTESPLGGSRGRPSPQEDRT